MITVWTFFREGPGLSILKKRIFPRRLILPVVCRALSSSCRRIGMFFRAGLEHILLG